MGVFDFFKTFNQKSSDDKDVLGNWFDQLDVSNGKVFESVEEEYETKNRIKIGIDRYISEKKQSLFYSLKTIYKVAAVFIFFILVAAIIFYRNSSVDQQSASITIMPGTSKAMITFANGERLNIIGEQQAAALAKVGIIMSKSGEGKLLCQFKNTAAEKGSYTIETPIGGEFQLSLADGSRIWMNAGSSVSFSQNFIAPQRKVKAKGEVYFEVAKMNDATFIVQTGPQMIEVLGTHFLVNTNNDNSLIKTTLLEGSIRLTNGSATKELKPGQVSKVTKGNNDIEILSKIEAKKTIAWKEGYFSFSNTDFKTAEEQIEKWYNVEFIYNKTPDYLFYGEISRKASIQDVLTMMEMVGHIKFKIDGRKIYVKE